MDILARATELAAGDYEVSQDGASAIKAEFKLNGVNHALGFTYSDGESDADLERKAGALDTLARRHIAEELTNV